MQLASVTVIYHLIYHLVIKHSHGKWPIEIDGFPIKNGEFSMAMLVITRWYPSKIQHKIPKITRALCGTRMVMKKHAKLNSVQNPLLVDVGEGVLQPLRHWALSQFMNCIYDDKYSPIESPLGPR